MQIHMADNIAKCQDRNKNISFLSETGRLAPLVTESFHPNSMI